MHLIQVKSCLHRIMSVYRTLDPAMLQSNDESIVNHHVDELNKKATFYVSETYMEDIAAE